MLTETETLTTEDMEYLRHGKGLGLGPIEAPHLRPRVGDPRRLTAISRRKIEC